MGHKQKSSCGSHAMKLKDLAALRSLKVPETNFRPKLWKMKSLLMFFKPRLQMLKNPKEDLDLTLMTFPWNMKEFMLQHSLLKNVQRTLIRSLENGRQKLLKLVPLRMKGATIALNFSV